MASSLRILRNIKSLGSFIGVFRKVEVFIDQKHVGFIAFKASSVFAVLPGDHIIYVKMDWCKSRQMSITFKPDEQVVLECHAPKLDVTRIITDPSDFFSLHRKYH